MKQFLVFASLVSVVLFSCRGRTEKEKEEAGEPIESLTRADTAEIIKQTIEIGFVEHKIPDWGLLDDTINIILNAYGMDPELIPSLPGKTFIVMTREQLQAKADREGDFHCAYITNPKIEDSKVLLGIGSNWIKSKVSKTVYISGGGHYLEFIKVNGKWKGKITGSWII